MRLNIGCGPFPAKGWVNVDLPSAVEHYGHHDVVPASMFSLPFPEKSCTAVYCGHVLEHIGLDVIEGALAEVRRVMADDAELMVVGPDIDLARERGFPREVLDGIRGDEATAKLWQGAGHAWVATGSRTAAVLNGEGFDVAPLDIEAVPSFWPVVSRIGWQFALLCHKRV